MAATRASGAGSTGRRARGAATARKSETTQVEDELSIGELAELTSVSTRTIRYYEELGILPTPPRTPGGTRRYPREYVFYVEGAKTLKQLGFGLEEIAELGRFALTGTSASKRTQAILQEKLADLEHRIRVLTRLHEIVAEATSANGRRNGEAVTDLLKWVSSEHEKRHN
jgi:MerR family transcriptional regulator, copper efflux regulator